MKEKGIVTYGKLNSRYI